MEISYLVDEVDRIDQLIESIDIKEENKLYSLLVEKKMSLIDRILAAEKAADEQDNKLKEIDIEIERLKDRREEVKLNFKASVFGSISTGVCNLGGSIIAGVNSATNRKASMDALYATMGIEDTGVITRNKSYNMAVNAMKSKF